MSTDDHFDPYLYAIRAAELKRMARFWGAPRGALPREAAMAVIRAGLADPRRVAGVLASLGPFERTVLALLRSMGGELDAAALALAVRAAGCRASTLPHVLRESPAQWLQSLADDGLLLTRREYEPHRVSDYYSYSQSTVIFADERLLRPSLRPELVPLPLDPVPAPALASARRPQSVLLDLMSVLQAIVDVGGLRLNRRGAFYLPELKRVGKLLGWPTVLDVDGLPFPELVRAVVMALSRSGLLTLAQERLVPAESIAQFSLRPAHESVTAMLRGFITAGDWWEWPTETGGWSSYRAPNYVQARGALWGALLALPEAGGAFFSVRALSHELRERIGEWVSLDYRTSRPSGYRLSVDEAKLAEAKWWASLKESWAGHEQLWLQSAFRTWLYWLGLVEVDGAVTAFRLTELGKTVLLRQPPAAVPADDVQAAAGPVWVVQPDFEVTVYLEHARPRQLALLECWAERQKAQRHVVQYRLTRQSVYQGLEAGHPLAELLAELLAGNGRELPQNVATELQGWAALREQITLHPGARLLEFASEAERQATLAAVALDGEPVGERFLLLRAVADAAAAKLPLMVHQRFRYDQPLPACLSVSARGALRLTTAHTDLLLRSEIEVWATPKGPTGWQLTAASVGRAVGAGHQVDDLLALLERRLVEPLPSALRLALRAWAGEPQGVSLTRVVVLRCPHREVLDAIVQDPDVKSLIQTRLGPTAVLVNSSRLPELRKILRWAGLTAEE
jgi:hypothetical protein